MGDYNETCYISKLPIKENEDIVLILLKQSDDEYKPHAMCPSENYCPFGLPIYGKYNDYGGIKKITNKEDVIEFLNQVNIVYKNKKVEFTINKLENMINDIIEKEDYATENYVLQRYEDQKFKISSLMVKRDLYDILIDHLKNRISFEKKKRYEDYLNDALDEYKIKIQEHLDGIKEIFGFLPESETNNHTFTGKFYSVTQYEYSDDVLPYLKKKIFEKDNEKDRKYLIEIKLLHNCLNGLRMGYYAITNGQSEEMLLHRIVAKYVLDKTDEVIKMKSEEDNLAESEENLGEYFF